MKKCYMCQGEVKKVLTQARINDVIVNDVPAEVCQRCGEQYFDTKTATFIQKVTRYIEEQKKLYTLDVMNDTSTIET